MKAPRAPGFGAGLGFAFLAALAWPLVSACLAPWLGAGGALRLHVAACAFLFALHFGPSRIAALRAAPGRALALELALGASAFALARLAGGPSVAETALAIWAFALVESAWPLFGAAAGPAAPTGLDPFDEARRRVEALLDEEP
jgi:hypothetical protein